jgi:hypothetical protein
MQEPRSRSLLIAQAQAQALAQALALALVLVVSGCATGPYGLEIRHAGKLDPAQNQATIEKATTLPWEGTYPVDVYMDTLPPGLVKDEATKAIKVAPDAEERISLLGVARSYQEHTRWVTQIRAVIFFETMHPMHSRTRDTYCKVQTPFRIVTLSLWSLTPFQWACFFDYSTDAQTNTTVHVQELKRAAHAMGGNLVVINGVTDRVETWSSGLASAQHKTENVEMQALVFLDRSKQATQQSQQQQQQPQQQQPQQQQPQRQPPPQSQPQPQPPAP